ncbi:hypothetical protein Goari_009409 [Gossypium aridum]|uniref:Uncharacterized protein n=1 Tax=Gossypium aridum TaxID=34290 RepID=A0A7J8XXL3_GOSAI|nr:hypothetical protein [Gossypium aridum]
MFSSFTQNTYFAVLTSLLRRLYIQKVILMQFPLAREMLICYYQRHLSMILSLTSTSSI